MRLLHGSSSTCSVDGQRASTAMKAVHGTAGRTLESEPSHLLLNLGQQALLGPCMVFVALSAMLCEAQLSA